MKLYYTKGACSLVVRIVINELNLACEYESVDLRAKKTEKNTDFLQINPKGAVPTLDIDGKILTENAVILQYLADKANPTSLLPPIDDFGRYRVLEWLNYITTELHKSFGAMFNPAIDEATKQKLFVPLITTKLSYVNKYLADHKPYLMGITFTLPDAYLYVMTRWAINFKFDLSEFPHLAQFVTEVQKRDAVIKSINEEGLSAI